MALTRTHSFASIVPFGGGGGPPPAPITRTYSRPTFATYMCSGGHWPSTTPCWPFAFSYYYPLSSSYYFYYTPWRFSSPAYRYYRILADNAWDQRFHYYTPPQRQPYDHASKYHEHSYKPSHINYFAFYQMVYAPVPRKCLPPPSSNFGPHNVFIDVNCHLPSYFRRNYSSRYKYSHFYGSCWNFTYSNYPLNALYKSSWLNRPYHNIGTATDWYY